MIKLPREVRFYATDAGSIPVKEWLIELSKEEKKIIGEDIRAAQLQEMWKKPIVGSLGNGLWEVRSTLQNSIARVIFFDHKGSMILLCAFTKKTQKTPNDIIKLATRRRKEYENAS